MTKIEIVRQHYTRFWGKARASHAVKMGHGHMEIDEYGQQPCEGAVTLATVGLSDLGGRTQPRTTRPLRQEFVFCCYESFMRPDVIALVAAVGEQLVASNDPLRRGDVLGPAGPILECSTMEALYACPPTYYQDEFATIAVNNLAIPVMWLIPIHRSEAAWIAKHGFSDFESHLEAADPDLMDLTRPPLRL
jgi:hypothetical protein